MQICMTVRLYVCLSLRKSVMVMVEYYCSRVIIILIITLAVWSLSHFSIPFFVHYILSQPHFQSRCERPAFTRGEYSTFLQL